MGSHPLNLAVRFILEVLVLVAVGLWGWRLSEHTLYSILASILFPILLMSIWVIFAVPDDPSRSGKAPIITLGYIRLLIEFIFFALGFYALYDLGYLIQSVILSAVVLIHYAVSYDRIVWLLKQK